MTIDNSRPKNVKSVPLLDEASAMTDSDLHALSSFNLRLMQVHIAFALTDDVRLWGYPDEEEMKREGPRTYWVTIEHPQPSWLDAEIERSKQFSKRVEAILKERKDT